MNFGHWERGPKEPLAAFEYERTEPRTWYDDEGDYGLRYVAEAVKQESTTAKISGEIVVRPSDGAIVRVTEIARTPRRYANDDVGEVNEIRNVVEYAPVLVAGKWSMCPVRRVVTSLWPIPGTFPGLTEPDARVGSFSESSLDGVQSFAEMTFGMYRLWASKPQMHTVKQSSTK